MLAFFWVELHSKNVIARDATGKARRINAVTRDQILFSRIDIITVDIIETVSAFYILPHGMCTACLGIIMVNLVPAHVRHLELAAVLILHVLGEAAYIPFKNA